MGDLAQQRLSCCISDYTQRMQGLSCRLACSFVVIAFFLYLEHYKYLTTCALGLCLLCRCIECLLQDSQKPCAMTIECLCQLLVTVGKQLDASSNTAGMQADQVGSSDPLLFILLFLKHCVNLCSTGNLARL